MVRPAPSSPRRFSPPRAMPRMFTDRSWPSGLKDLGYTIERGEYGQPEIKGYTKEYLEASSPRREQVKDHLRASGLEGAAAAQIAAHRTRDSKELLSPEEVLRQHRELAAQHGHQADRVVAEAREHESSSNP